MTFLELQQELSTVPAARFKSTQASSYKHWLNYRAAELWNLEDWSFRKAYTSSLTVTGGSNVATSPSDLGILLGLWTDLGDEVTYLAPRDYFSQHVGSTSTGTPENYTIINKSILLDPTPSASSSTWTAHYDRAYCHKNAGGVYVAGDMSVDTDTPALPDECHYLLIHVATAMGGITMNDFTYQFAEQGGQQGIESMRRNYLVDQRGAPQQWGSVAW